jgi:hypothetical protein
MSLSGGGNRDLVLLYWIPAFAGMTGKGLKRIFAKSSHLTGFTGLFKIFAFSEDFEKSNRS